jgi:hypothetical protein
VIAKVITVSVLNSRDRVL